MNTPKKFTKKPVTVEAMEFREDNGPEVADWCEGTYYLDHAFGGFIVIKTLEGRMTANVGGYVIKGIQGEFYPCKPDVFWESYREESQDGPGEALYDSAITGQLLSQSAAKGLGYLLALQRQVETAWDRLVDPGDPAAVSRYVREVVLCATDELHEVLGEVFWKPWQTSKGIKDIVKYRKEMSDVLHFVLDLYLAAGMTGQDIVSDYLATHYDNLERRKNSEYVAGQKV